MKYDGLVMDGVQTTPDSGQRAVHRTLPSAAFPSMMQEAFIGAFPIGGIGSSFTMPVMNPPDTAVHNIKFDVVREETLRTADGPVRSLLLTAGQNGSIQTWVAADDGRLMRLHWTLPNGMSIWKLPKHDVNFRDGATP